MKVLVTGGKGQLGSDLNAILRTVDGVEVHAPGSTELDITDSLSITAAFRQFAPDVVINAAAYTAVDAAETEEEAAYRVNAAGPALLATAAARSGTRLIHVSTDYVFAGDASAPYEVDAPTAPRSAYGRTKLAGEQAVRELLPALGYVVRTAWVYGASGSNFVKTMARLEKERETVSVVDDQRGSPTWSADLAIGLAELARSDAPAGIYHATGGGEVSWYGFARAIFEELGADPDRVLPTTTEAFPRPAPRPTYSVLSNAGWVAAGLSPLAPWREALASAMEAIRAAEALGA